MYFIFVLLIGLYLGYKLRLIVELLSYLKIKNYVKICVEKYEDNNFNIIRECIKDKKKEVASND